MRVGEHSKVTQKYLDPERYLYSLFPAHRECGLCHTMIVLETVGDVKHNTYTHEHASYRKDWLEWTCPICHKINQFTAEEVLVNTHRKLIRSSKDTMEWVSISLLILFILIFFASCGTL